MSDDNVINLNAEAVRPDQVLHDVGESLDDIAQVVVVAVLKDGTHDVWASGSNESIAYARAILEHRLFGLIQGELE